MRAIGSPSEVTKESRVAAAAAAPVETLLTTDDTEELATKNGHQTDHSVHWWVTFSGIAGGSEYFGFVFHDDAMRCDGYRAV